MSTCLLPLMDDDYGLQMELTRPRELKCPLPRTLARFLPPSRRISVAQHGRQGLYVRRLRYMCRLAHVGRVNA